MISNAKPEIMFQFSKSPLQLLPHILEGRGTYAVNALSAIELHTSLGLFGHRIRNRGQHVLKYHAPSFIFVTFACVYESINYKNLEFIDVMPFPTF